MHNLQCSRPVQPNPSVQQSVLKQLVRKPAPIPGSNTPAAPTSYASVSSLKVPPPNQTSSVSPKSVSRHSSSDESYDEELKAKAAILKKRRQEKRRAEAEAQSPTSQTNGVKLPSEQVSPGVPSGQAEAFPPLQQIKANDKQAYGPTSVGMGNQQEVISGPKAPESPQTPKVRCCLP